MEVQDKLQIRGKSRNINCVEESLRRKIEPWEGYHYYYYYYYYYDYYYYYYYYHHYHCYH